MINLEVNCRSFIYLIFAWLVLNNYVGKKYIIILGFTYITSKCVYSDTMLCLFSSGKKKGGRTQESTNEQQ